MARGADFKKREAIVITLEEEELKAFDEIRWREHKDRTKLGRLAIQEYIKAHAAGNTVYTLDDFGKHHDLIAIPALMSNKDTLKTYIEEERDITELRRVKEQAEYLVHIINTKVMNRTYRDDEESRRINDQRSERFRRQNDIRYKDPTKMSWNEKLRYNQIMARQKEVEDSIEKGKLNS